MWDMASNVLKSLLAAVSISMVGCAQQFAAEPPKEIQLYQTWELQPGDVVGGHAVLGGLGDVAIALRGDSIYAPFEGRVQPHKPECVIFSGEELPTYLFRLCGLTSPRFGLRRVGEAIGKGQELRLSVLNKQPDGRWAMVEPSKQIIEQMLQPP